MFRPTLRQVFALSPLGLLLCLALLFYRIFESTQETILQTAERLRKMESGHVINRTTAYLEEAPAAVAYFENQIHHGIVDPQNADSIRTGLLSQLLANTNISEATFTYGESEGYDPNGYIKILKPTAGQVTVYRKDGHLFSRHTWFVGGQFVASTAALDSSASRQPLSADPAMDPTEHDTFRTPAMQDQGDVPIWTDLHWSQLDEMLPENQRRVEMSVLQALKDPSGKFEGVLRVGLLKEQIDRAFQSDSGNASPATAPLGLSADDDSRNDPSLVFLCDTKGRLITGIGGHDRIIDSDGDLRVDTGGQPASVMAALRQPALKSLAFGQTASTAFSLQGRTYLCTFKAFPGDETQEWVVGIVVPRDFYLGQLQKMRQQLLWVSLVLIAVIIKVSLLILHSIGRAHSLIVRETAKMNVFEFSRSQNSSRLRDIADVLASLEKSKTAMRAMGKYVPVDLVRRLYQDGREPVLGGESVDLSVLFTDIKGFTSFAEQNEPDRVADILGRYLQAMASAIQCEKGTIDKFIGDSVMAFWNAPEGVPRHPLLACGAALKCRAALRALYDSAEWKETPAFDTRYGLHRCEAHVGHFGAPDRFNYTAIGDGINLASRLEGLNNYYGTSIIASESIYAAAGEQFDFRLLDRVAVKGKAQGITIYELLGERAKDAGRPPVIGNYEKAFEQFQHGNFAAALALLDKESQDKPSLALAKRCREFIDHPPGKDWNGIRVFETK